MHLPIDPDNKLQIFAFVFCIVSILFWFGCKVYRLIRNYKREQEEKNKILPVGPPLSPFVFVIYHIETFSVVKSFVIEDECIEYFKKNYTGNPAYSWVGINLLHYGSCLGDS